MNATELATELTVAWLSNPNTRASVDDVPAFLNAIKTSLDGLISGSEPEVVEEPASYEAAVTARKSLASPDHIISMIDGKPYKTLRRHLNTNGLSPEQYRERYNLKSDYPMVAATYSEARRAMAKKIGLGRKPKAGADDASGKAPVRKPVAKRPVAENTEG